MGKKCVYCNHYVGSDYYQLTKAVKPKGKPYRKINLKSVCCESCAERGAKLNFEYGEKCEVE